MLVRGLLSSGSTMLHTLVLCVVILYIFGCISIEMITLAVQDKEDQLPEEVMDLVQTHFRSLPTAMLTLVQFISFDNIVYIYKPMIEADPKLAIFFILAILVVGVALMNLVTAVIVNSAMEQALQDKDLMRSLEAQKKKKMLKELRQMFVRLDVDGSGDISRDELVNMCKEDQQLLSGLLTTNSPVEMFDALDIDGSGDIDINEFCRGVEQVAFSNTPIELKRMERQIEFMHKQLKASKDMQDSLRFAIQQLREELHQPWPAFSPFQDSKPNPQCVAPPWVSELANELRQACNRDMRRIVADTCQPLATQLSDITTLLQQRPVFHSEVDVPTQEPSGWVIRTSSRRSTGSRSPTAKRGATSSHGLGSAWAKHAAVASVWADPSS